MQIDDDEDINIEQYDFLVYASHHQFYIDDLDLSKDFLGEYTDIAAWLRTFPGTIMVETACDDIVPVRVIVQDRKPDDKYFVRWDHVAEASINVPSDNLYLTVSVAPNDDSQKIPIKTGIYRARIYWAGINYMQQLKELGEEYYKIIFWPEEYKPIQVLKGHHKDALLQTFGVDRDIAQKIFAEIEAQYSEETRHYHTGAHIKAMLDFISYYYYELYNPLAVHLAIWFHDVIYDTRAKNNEGKSAEYAEKVLSEVGVPGEVITRVKELVLATKSHQAPPDDFDCQLFLDCDLAILGATKDVYDEYAKNIRLEYSWVSEEDYRRGRKQVLEKFLQRDRIFYVYNYEGQARRNLEREIASLG